MVFGDPIARIAGTIGFLREGYRRGDGIAGGLIGAHGDKVKDRKFQKGHTAFNTRAVPILPAVKD